MLADKRLQIIGKDDRVLHFAPEQGTEEVIRKKQKHYATADLFRSDVDHKVDIEKMDIEADSFDVAICCHVLEHVDDQLALPELHRILRPSGRLVAMVPMIEGWPDTYENPAVQSPEDRLIHFGQHNHARYYGASFRDRLADAGFRIEEFTANAQDTVAHGLLRGEKVFVCRKTPGLFSGEKA